MSVCISFFYISVVSRRFAVFAKAQFSFTHKHPCSAGLVQAPTPSECSVVVFFFVVPHSGGMGGYSPEVPGYMSCIANASGYVRPIYVCRIN